MNNNFIKYKDEINKYLDAFFVNEINNAKKISKIDMDIVKNAADFTLRGGKRIRAILMILAYKAIKGEVDDEIIKTSIAMELAQSSLLVHDDIMDRDTLRRGGATVHTYFSNYNGIRSEIFGQSMGILAGNILSFFALKVILESKYNDEAKNAAVNKMTRLLTDVNFGQAMDLESANSRVIDEKTVKQIHIFKTMTYTSLLPLSIGMVLSNANDEENEILKKYAQKIGLAFQIADDLIGVFGTESETGKSVYSDLEENKKTFLVTQALEKADSKDRDFIKKILGNKINKDQFARIKKIFVESGSLEYSLDMAKRYVDGAKEVISQSKFSRESKDDFIQIADFIINREKINY